MPVKSNMEAMAKYVGKYIAKHVENRLGQDKGVKLVRYSKGARTGNNNFSFYSAGSMIWRAKVAVFAQLVQERYPERKVVCLADLRAILGPRWAYNHRPIILSIPI